MILECAPTSIPLSDHSSSKKSKSPHNNLRLAIKGIRPVHHPRSRQPMLRMLPMVPIMVIVLATALEVIITMAPIMETVPAVATLKETIMEVIIMEETMVLQAAVETTKLLVGMEKETIVVIKEATMIRKVETTIRKREEEVMEPKMVVKTMGATKVTGAIKNRDYKRNL